MPHTGSTVGDVIQVGLAILPDTSSSAEDATVKEINLKFRVHSRPYNKNTLEFLRKHHDFDALESYGIPCALLAEWLVNKFGRFYDRRVTWVVFQGDYDIAFLLNMLGNSMPDTVVEHLGRHTCCFPLLYDVRTLSRLIFGADTRGLNWVASEINIQRTGDEHSSGSDALLTLECFLELRSRLGASRTNAFRGILSGLYDVEQIVSEALPMGHTNLQEVHVWLENFDDESAVIAEAVQLGYYILGVDVTFSPALVRRQVHMDNQRCFDLTINALRAVSHYNVSLSLLSYRGQLPIRKCWKFHLTEYANAPHYTHFTRFGKLLADCNLLGNDRIIWVCQMKYHQGFRTMHN